MKTHSRARNAKKLAGKSSVITDLCQPIHYLKYILFKLY